MTWCRAILEAIWYSSKSVQARGSGGVGVGTPANREHQPEMIQLVDGERKDDQLKMSQRQVMSPQAKEEVHQAYAHVLDGSHSSQVPPDGNIDQSDTLDHCLYPTHSHCEHQKD